MVPTITKEELIKKIEDINSSNEYYSIKSSQRRARSITCGTAFNGTVEVTVRTEADFIYAVLHPPEVVELIHSMAAIIGCNVKVTPRQDFATWREWANEYPVPIGEEECPIPEISINNNKTSSTSEKKYRQMNAAEAALMKGKKFKKE